MSILYRDQQLSQSERAAGQSADTELWERLEARRREAEAMADLDTPRSVAPRDPPAPVPASTLDGTPYVELHAHSHYSLLEGASSIDELVAAATVQGHRALALTDHEALYGAMQFAHAAHRVGLRPITGLELTVREADGTRHHVTLLAETRAGYAHLCRLSSLAFGLEEETAEGREARRLDPEVPVDALRAHSAGLILLTGCREGLLAQLVEAHRLADAEAALRRWAEWFGAGNIFVEIMDNLVAGDRPRNRALVALAGRVGVGVVGTGDVHYHERGRHRLQDVLVSVKHRTTLDGSHRVRRPNAEFFLRPPEVQARRFARYHPEAAANSVRIARRCAFDLTADLGYRLPSPPVAAGRTPLEELERLCRQRLRQRYAPHQQAAAGRRLADELRLVDLHGLAGFFLVYAEVFALATEVAEEVRGPSRARSVTGLPPGRGRGSSVASIICYLIGLSHIDPIANGLTIDRFLNDAPPETRSLPDIDLDFPRDIRERLIERVYERWGRDHAALVATFPTYRLRSAIRDVGKALGLPETELDRVAKRAHPFEHATGIEAELAHFPETAARRETREWSHLVDLAGQLAGFPRHLSQHPGGMVIASEPLVDCVPCQPARWPNRYLAQWDKDSVDDAHMVKIDFLGLGMLSVVEECVDLIEQHRGRVVDLSRIDFEDAAVYDAICRGDTVGVFQVESRAQIAMLPRTQPRTLADLAVQVSIVRPGPIVGGAVNPYVRRRERQRRDPHYVPEVPHECVRSVLEETLGVVLFQDQVLAVARDMGGFSAGEADQFRRAMSRRRSRETMAGYRERFLAGAAERDVPRATAEEVFEQLMGFAEFGFPKSHGVAFALLAYQSTWLKLSYPPEYTCALLNEQPMGFYPAHVLTRDAQRHGVAVYRPDINRSRATCTVEDVAPEQATADTRGAVRVGLGYVRGVGAAGAARIEAERDRDGPFVSLFDFVQRTGVAQEAVTNLVRIGAFDAFGLKRRELIWQLGLLSGGFARAELRRPRDRQLRMSLPTAQDEVALADFSSYERMAADYAVLRLSPDRHPMQYLRGQLGEGVVSSAHLRSMPAGRRVDFAGLVVCRQQPLTARGIVFLLLEDEYGMTNVLVGKDLVERDREAVRATMFVQVWGKLETRAGEQRTIIAERVEAFLPNAALAVPEGKSWG